MYQLRYFLFNFTSQTVPGSLNSTCTPLLIKLGLFTFIVKVASKAVKMVQSGVQCALCCKII